jgi:hypothetical protein
MSSEARVFQLESMVLALGRALDAAEARIAALEQKKWLSGMSGGGGGGGLIFLTATSDIAAGTSGAPGAGTALITYLDGSGNYAASSSEVDVANHWTDKGIANGSLFSGIRGQDGRIVVINPSACADLIDA